MKNLPLVTMAFFLITTFSSCILTKGCGQEVFESERNRFDIYEVSDSTWRVEFVLGANDGDNHAVIIDGEAFGLEGKNGKHLTIRQVPELILGVQSTVHSFRDTVYLPLSPVFGELSINGVQLTINDTTTIATADTFWISWKPLLSSPVRDLVSIEGPPYLYGAQMELQGEDIYGGVRRLLTDLLKEPGDERKQYYLRQTIESGNGLEVRFYYHNENPTGDQNNRLIKYDIKQKYFYKVN